MTDVLLGKVIGTREKKKPKQIETCRISVICDGTIFTPYYCKETVNIHQVQEYRSRDHAVV